jgi:hypothetical protein
MTRLRLIAFALALVAIPAAFGLGRCTGPEPPPPPPLPPLPPEVVEVKVVDQEALDRLAGELRTAEGKVAELEGDVQARTVEIARLRGEVRPVPPEAREAIKEYVVLDPALTDLEAVAGTEGLQKVEGLEGDRVVAGWRGRLFCDVRMGSDAPWVRLYDGPLDLTESEAVSSRPAGTVEEQLASWRAALRVGISSDPGLRAGLSWYGRKRVGWWADLDYDLDRSEWAIAGGPELSLGRR